MKEASVPKDWKEKAEKLKQKDTDAK